MFGAIRTLVCLFVVLVGASILDHDKATAEPIQLKANLCALPGGADLSAKDVFARRTEFKCTQDKFLTSAQHYWVLVDMPTAGKFMQEPVWRVRFARYGPLTAHLRYSDGTIETQRYSLEHIEDNWRAPSAFSMPIAQKDKLFPETLLLSVERPWDSWNLAEMAILEADEDLRDHRNAQLLSIVFTCLMCAPLLLNLFFYAFMRVRFALLHALMVFSWIVIPFFWDGLAFQFLPALDVTSRSIIIHIMLSVNVSLFCLLVRDICEPHKLGFGGRKWLLRWSVFQAVVTAIALLAPNSVSTISSAVYQLTALMTFIAIMFFTLRTALRGSRVALALLLGTGGFVVIMASHILNAYGILASAPTFEQSVYPSVLFEALVYSCIVASKAIAMRKQHDLAVLENSILFKQASTDELTGLLNRRAFVDTYGQTLEGPQFAHHHWALAVMDIDHFKQINDTYGHGVGDVCLQQLSRLLKSAFKDNGHCARIGGEEFVVLFQAKTPAEIERIANNFRLSVASYTFGSECAHIGRMTVSIGLLHLPRKQPVSFDIPYKAADSALYAAKAAGRNRVEVADLKRIWQKGNDAHKQLISHEIVA